MRHPVPAGMSAPGHGVVQGVTTTPAKSTETTYANTPDPATGLTPADLRRAALSVCAYVEDAAEARELLDALGLLDELRGATSLAS